MIKQIITGLLLGIFSGIITQILFSADQVFFIWFIEYICNSGGILFIGMVKLLVVPLVFVSIVHAICNLEDISHCGRLGIKIFTIYLLNSALAIAVAIIVTLFSGPGRGFSLYDQHPSPDITASVHSAQPATVLNFIQNLVPHNPFQAFAEGNILQILFMAVMVGVAINKLENEDTHGVSKAFSIANNVIMKLTKMVMNLAPWGVFFLSTKLAATLDSSAISAVVGYLSTALSIMAFWLLFFYPAVVFAFTNMKPFIFLSKVREQMLFAFTTSSSNATIPVSYRTLTLKMGVPEKIAGFSIPLGATLNMSGAAIYITVAALFLVNIYDIQLTFSELLNFAVTAFFMSVATGGVPGGVIVTTGILIETLGLPPEAIAIVVATDRILDVGCTVTNVVGDTVVGVLVAHSERKAAKNGLSCPDDKELIVDRS